MATTMSISTNLIVKKHKCGKYSWKLSYCLHAPSPLQCLLQFSDLHWSLSSGQSTATKHVIGRIEVSANWLMFQRGLYRYVYCRVRLHPWISCTRSRYNYVQYYVLHICVSFHFPIYTHIVLNGMRSCGEILGIRELLHWLIHECWRTSKHWSEWLLGSTWPCNVYCCYSMYDPKKFNFVNLWWMLILILPVSK